MRDIKFHCVRRCMEPGTRLTPDNVLRDVGILADGTLYNPNGYPDDVVRSAVLKAIERRKKRRSDGAKKAAVTRAVRMERRVYEVVRKIGLGHKYGPCASCCICDKELGDQQSIERGIGSDCWQRVMKAMTQKRGDSN
jgi:hypothetical protein